jgi:dienelactone hydrolase
MEIKQIEILSENVVLPGILTIPPQAQGLVLFAHGSGSGRLSPRNQFVAGVLHQHHIATLLFDLLTPAEDRDYENRFNIELLAERLIVATNWIKEKTVKHNFKLGYFGASTGAAAAIKSAVCLKKDVAAVVSRGGRPDLASNLELGSLSCPILLIVGGDDTEVIQLNKLAYNEIKSKKQLDIIPGATHLFEEAGTLEQVAELAANWFAKYLI